MMKRKQRAVAAVLVLLFVSVFLMACSVQKEPLQEEKQLLQAQWEKYLAATDEIYGYLHWAFDYAEAFAEDNSYGSLLKARAACSAAKQKIAQLEGLEFQLTDTQYHALVDAGIEADVVLMEFDAFEGEQAGAINTLNTLESKLLNDVFMTAHAEILPDLIECDRNLVLDISDYLCVTTNYLLLQIGDTELWERMVTDYPNIGAVRGSWLEDPEALMNNCSEVLDRYESRLVQMEAFAGVAEYAAEILQEAEETGNFERLAAQIHTVSDVPAYFPAPFWMPEDAVYSYFVTDSESVQAGEKITQVPTFVSIACGSIAQEDVEAYAGSLEDLGFAVDAESNSENRTFVITVTSAGSTMTVEWTEENTMMTLTSPVGCLLGEAYLTAMLQN